MTDQFQFDNPIIPGSIWDKKSDFTVPIVSPVGAGPKGEKGDAAYFDDLTEEQLQKIYQEASFVGNKSFDEVVTTTGASTTTIPIPWADYDQFDMLFIDVNGLDLSEHDDYEISGTTVILTTPLPAGQNVHFRLLRYDVVDGDKNIVNTMGRHDYNTVAEMQADLALEPGDICHTLGFHAVGDGGAAWYKIMAHGVANGMDILQLDNDLFAIAVIEPCQVVKSTSELADTLSDVVLVIESDDVFNSSNTVVYETTDETIGTVARTNGTYLRPKAKTVCDKTSTIPNKLAKVVGSYVGRENLSYGGENLFAETCTNEIDCSSFVTACLYGVTYENSRYVLGSSADNIYDFYAGNIMPSNNGRIKSLLTWEMARWFAEQGLLYEFPSNSHDAIQMLATGDVLFSSSNTYPGRIYGGIDHCMMVLQVFPEDGSVLIAQGGGYGLAIGNYQSTVVKISLIDFLHSIEQNRIKYFARPSYNIADDSIVNISGKIISNGTVGIGQVLPGNTINMGTLFFEKPIKAGDVFSVSIKGLLPSYNVDGCYMYVRGILADGTTQQNIISITKMYQKSGELYFTAAIPNNDTSIYYGLEFRTNWAEHISDESTFRLDEAGCVLGIAKEIKRCKPFDIEFSTTISNAFSGLTNHSYINPDGKVIISITGRWLGVGGDYTVGTYDANLTPFSTNLNTNPTYIIGRLGATDPFLVRFNNGNMLISSSVSSAKNFSAYGILQTH